MSILKSVKDMSKVGPKRLLNENPDIGDYTKRNYPGPVLFVLETLFKLLIYGYFSYSFPMAGSDNGRVVGCMMYHTKT